ncbi:E7 protein [Giraffa camelopardalis papillomavirus 1]|uniref:E7 protein n=1 Tax=Giraffa camelopardalis papillomavirus 1 TaxID=1922325 RepID=A0A1L3GVA6_9PAPI|nr:E7 protein [Giraffa camelopardalis papillomavirus 1]APG30980.1 E7 protein [Giraffa camelopardalis papillomavirus 1]
MVLGPSTTKNLPRDESPAEGPICLMLQPLHPEKKLLLPPPRPRPRKRPGKHGLYLIGLICGSCPQPLHFVVKACPTAIPKLEELLNTSVTVLCPSCGKKPSHG